MTMSLRWRLTLVYTAVFGLLLAGLGGASYALLARQLDADASDALADLAAGLHGYLRFDSGAPLVVFDRDDADQAAFVREATRYYQLFDAATGTLLVQSDALAPMGVQFTPDEVRAFRDDPRPIDLQTSYAHMRLWNGLITGPGGHIYLLQVGAPLDTVDRALDRFLTLLLVGLPAGLLLGVAAGTWMGRAALMPLSRVAQAARTIDVADLHRRLPVRGAGDEVDDVARAFNDTLDRLTAAVGEMRQFSAALAHELRTPLAALRGEIELARRQGPEGPGSDRLASQLEEIDKLTRLIDQLLTLARAESGEIRLTCTRVDLRALVGSLVDQLDLVAQASGIMLRCEGDEAVLVDGDPGWLERLILNLLDNALKFTPAGGTVTGRVLADAPEAVVEVRDTGPGIPPEIQPHIFDRFFRGDPARTSPTGAGVGLSLARWIVERHHGRLTVESRCGEGAIFRIHLPLAPREP